MWKENLYQPIEVLIREHSVFPINEHQHSFFEIAYIAEGNGSFYLYNSGKSRDDRTYSAGSVFLIPPDTVHCFTINTFSKFVFIRFTEHYAEDYLGKHIARSLLLNNTFPLTINDNDLYTVESVIKLISGETVNRHKFSNWLIQYYTNSLILLIARNINASGNNDNTTDDKQSYMIQYIQQHINEPELLKPETIGKVFNLSPNYIGHYFKRNFKEDLKQYITRNRIKMVENLLLNSHLSIKEISYRMGYNDSCHMIKVFRMFYGTTPSKYRNLKSKNQS